MSNTPHSHPDYEEQDVNPGFIGVLFGGILVLITLALIAIGGLVTSLSAYEEPPFVEETRLPQSGSRLQANPAQEWADYRSTEKALLSSSGWIDREAGIARIPIDEAMATVAADGTLPTFDTPEATPETSAEATERPSAERES